ncbi:MAG: helix-turn-helix transcriptional regulator [Deltaproteobacteria bacterium]|nr:helix-turn-helix transcriptional regulator [Deltaproteobacteria bacterium]
MEKKEELIIKTAQELFARFGFNKTTVDEIAQKAHIGKSTIYHYFESKEEL